MLIPGKGEAAAVKAVTKQESWGELGQAMRALPNERWRNFVRHYVIDFKCGAATRAYPAACFASSDDYKKQNAYRLLHDQRIIDAIAEESRKVLREAHPEAVNALLNLIRDPAHKLQAISANVRKWPENKENKKQHDTTNPRRQKRN